MAGIILKKYARITMLKAVLESIGLNVDSKAFAEFYLLQKKLSTLDIRQLI